VLSQAIDASILRQDLRERFVDSLFDVLLVDTFPELSRGQVFDVYAHQMRSSIFVPRIEIEGARSVSSDRPRFAKAEGEGCDVGAEVASRITCSYGTQKQTVVFVDRSGMITSKRELCMTRTLRRLEARGCSSTKSCHELQKSSVLNAAT
jgi:hypothetical protein